MRRSKQMIYPFYPSLPFLWRRSAHLVNDLLGGESAHAELIGGAEVEGEQMLAETRVPVRVQAAEVRQRSARRKHIHHAQEHAQGSLPHDSLRGEERDGRDGGQNRQHSDVFMPHTFGLPKHWIRVGRIRSR